MEKLKIKIRRMLCAHWWKAMTSFSSAYFVNIDGVFIEFEISECKICGKHKTVKL